MEKKLLYFLIPLLLFEIAASAQERRRQPAEIESGQTGNEPQPRTIGPSGMDSLRRRDVHADSITIWYRLLDSASRYQLDSTVNDFTKRYPVPAHHMHLGNTGTASRSLLFSPRLRAGFDPGFHAYDIYKWKKEEVPFFYTTRPYTELGYVLGSRVEQVISIIHTQNISPEWNAGFRYRLINSPGFFKNLKTNHNNYLFHSWYNSRNRRYNNFFMLLANHMQSGQSGGIRDDEDYLNDPTYDDRFNIPTKIGGDPQFGRDFFSTNISTGTRDREFTALMRQQYDLGRKDSIVTDSAVFPLFYPRVRFEHTVEYTSGRYRFFDELSDSAYYQDNYDLTISPGEDILFEDIWKELRNEVSIYQFPDPQNLRQFIRLGGMHQNLNREGGPALYNLMAFAEYRNRTKNQKWDLLAFGRLWAAGYNSGDYHAYASLERISGNLGSLKLGFENINRKPSFIFDTRSAFYFDDPYAFGKENISHIFGTYEHPGLKLRLAADYFLISNYSYITEFYRLKQEAALFNLLRISAQKVFRIGRHINWYADVYLQQKTGDVQLNFPSLFTRQRLAFEGNFYTNLHLSTGIELRYHTPYKADNFSPVLGQFFYQNETEISNLPGIDLFLNFRIRSFKAYARVENLNTLEGNDGFGFTNNNFSAPGYPYPGMLFRLGIYWVFVN